MSEESFPSGAPEPPPRGTRVMAMVRWVILVMSFAVAGGSWYVFVWPTKASALQVLYQCPMHPEIVSSQPGECPICHMTLEKVSGDRVGNPSGAPAAAAAPARVSSVKVGQYTCPMHPEVVSDTKGRCPKCKMDLVEVKAPHANEARPEHTTPSGVTSLGLSLDRIQAIGVRTTLAEQRSAAIGVRAPAVVEAPEHTAAEVHVRAAGFVEGIAVGQTGVRVSPGQRLVSVYSPEIYQAQSELLALQNWPALQEDGGAEQRPAGARRKLELLGISGRLADQVIAQRQPLRTTDVTAPIGGYVTTKNVVLGSFVTPEMVLYEIVDLSRVYVVADLFQNAATSVKVGTKGTFRPSTRAESIEVTADLIYPRVNEQARTTRVRMTLKNEKLRLLPGEYGIVEFATAQSTLVVIPTDALIDTGTDRYVFVEEQPGHFSPRVVDVGREVDGGYEVTTGVEPGESVVSGAAFLIDSESRLRASLSRAAPDQARPTVGESGTRSPSSEHKH